MQPNRIIALDRATRLLKKVRRYLSDMDAYLSDTPTAVNVFLDALPHVDTRTALQLIPLLEHTGNDRVQQNLFDMIVDSDTAERIRRAAALQLGNIAARCEDATGLRYRLIHSLKHPNPSIRLSCALALGWEGNWPAVAALTACLSDSDRDVRAGAVAALCSVGDEPVFDLLVHRLKTSPDEERSCIFLNIWRFAKRGTDVEKVYLKHLKAASINLQVDIVVGLGMLSLTPTLVDTYRSLLVRADDPIRWQVLENLASTGGHHRSLFKAELADLISHQDDRIRQAAVRLWAGR